MQPSQFNFQKKEAKLQTQQFLTTVSNNGWYT